MRAGLARRSTIMAGFAAVSAGGLLVYLFGSRDPGCLLSASCRHNHGELHQNPGANLMLEQEEEDMGSAVALMSCFGVLMGASGMAVISQDWGDTVRVLGAMNL